MPACLVKFHALFTVTIEVNASYFPHFAAFNLTILLECVIYILAYTPKGCTTVMENWDFPHNSYVSVSKCLSNQYPIPSHHNYIRSKFCSRFTNNIRILASPFSQ